MLCIAVLGVVLRQELLSESMRHLNVWYLVGVLLKVGGGLGQRTVGHYFENNVPLFPLFC